MLLVKATEGVTVPITYVQSAVPKGAGEKIYIIFKYINVYENCEIDVK